MQKTHGINPMKLTSWAETGLKSIGSAPELIVQRKREFRE
jgi:hypothetical protein